MRAGLSNDLGRARVSAGRTWTCRASVRAGTLAAMRVHLGTDHAGLDLKQHLIDWLRDQGHEPVDHGAFVYDALDDYPVFCLRAADGRGRRPGEPGRRHRRLRQRRADRGQQGEGRARGAGVERGDRGPGPAAQRRQRDLGRRPDAHRRRDDPLRRAVPRHRRSPARSGTSAGSRCWPTTSRPATSRRCRPAPAARRTEPMPEGHTLHRLATELTDAFAGRPVRVSSPQGRFAARPRSSTARRCWSRSPPASTCSSTSTPTGSSTCTSG